MAVLIQSVSQLFDVALPSRQFLATAENDAEASELRRQETSFWSRFLTISQEEVMAEFRDLAKSSFAWSPFSTLEMAGRVLYRSITDMPVDEKYKSNIAIVSYDVANALGLASPPRSVFARHPLCGKRYFPVAQFHNSVFQDRVMELEKLAACLGAKKISVEIKEANNRAGEANLGSKFGTESYSAAGTARSVELRSIGLSGSFPKPSEQPTIPDGLLWYSIEPMWRQMAELRISHGRLDYQLGVVSNNTYGVTADLAASFEGVKLNIGGKYSSVQEEKFTVNIDFWPIPGSE